MIVLHRTKIILQFWNDPNFKCFVIVVFGLYPTTPPISSIVDNEFENNYVFFAFEIQLLLIGLRVRLVRCCQRQFAVTPKWISPVNTGVDSHIGVKDRGRRTHTKSLIPTFALQILIANAPYSKFAVGFRTCRVFSFDVLDCLVNHWLCLIIDFLNFFGSLFIILFPWWAWNLSGSVNDPWLNRFEISSWFAIRQLLQDAKFLAVVEGVAGSALKHDPLAKSAQFEPWTVIYVSNDEAFQMLAWKAVEKLSVGAHDDDEADDDDSGDIHDYEWSVK